MCNDYRLEVEAAAIVEDFADLKIKIRFSEGMPNIQARQDIKMTDTAPIVRMIEDETGAGDLVQRRWSWPGQNGKPVYNYRDAVGKRHRGLITVAFERRRKRDRGHVRASALTFARGRNIADERTPRYPAGIAGSVAVRISVLDSGQ
jgi:putative SOS response-associated peptidase YedK